jgi:hypothetical protein
MSGDRFRRIHIMPRHSPILTAGTAAVLLLALVASACSRPSAPQLSDADGTAAAGQDRPLDGTGAYPSDLPGGHLDVAALAELEAAERELALAEREAEVAAREAELAARERQGARSTPPRASSPARQAPAPVAAPPTEPARAYQPPPPARPTSVAATVPAHTAVSVELVDYLSSAGSNPGDFVRGRVGSGVQADGVTAIPAGSRLTGSVTEVRSPGKIGGRARLAVHFDRLELPWGEVVPVSLAYAVDGRDESSRDAATIAGGAAAGAVAGRVLKKGDDKRDQRKAAAIGAVIGAAAGTTAAAMTKPEEVDLPAGTTLSLLLGSSVSVSVPR